MTTAIPRSTSHWVPSVHRDLPAPQVRPEPLGIQGQPVLLVRMVLLVPSAPRVLKALKVRRE